MSNYDCEHGEGSMGRYCDKCKAEREAAQDKKQLLPDPTTATAQDIINLCQDKLNEAIKLKREAEELSASAINRNDRLLAVIDERDHLQKFKDFVHKRLDEIGIPTHPEGKHSKEGCRIGDRLDIVQNLVGMLQKLVKTLEVLKSCHIVHDSNCNMVNDSDNCICNCGAQAGLNLINQALTDVEGMKLRRGMEHSKKELQDAINLAYNEFRKPEKGRLTYNACTALEVAKILRKYAKRENHG